MVAASKTLFWAMVFLLIVLYTFSIMGQQVIGEAQDCPDDQPDCGAATFEFSEEVGNQNELFGSIDRTMLTLFVCSTELCGQKVLGPIVVKSPALVVFYLIFTFMTTFGILNLVVSAFCEQSLGNAQGHEEELAAAHDKQREEILQGLRAAFEEMDQDKSGAIT